MKTPNPKNKLVYILKKRTIANLNHHFMARVAGGSEEALINLSLINCSVACSITTEDCPTQTTRDRGIPPTVE